MRKRLGEISDAAVIVVALLVVGLVVQKYVLAPKKPPGLLSVGDTLSDIEPVRLGAGRDRTLLLVLERGCQYCKESTPFYRELAELKRSGETQVHLLAVFADGTDTGEEFLRTDDVHMEVVGGVDPAKLRIGVTPTLILVDGNGRVLRIWEGLLSRKREEELKSLLRAAEAF